MPATGAGQAPNGGSSDDAMIIALVGALNEVLFALGKPRINFAGPYAIGWIGPLMSIPHIIYGEEFSSLKYVF